MKKIGLISMILIILIGAVPYVVFAAGEPGKNEQGSPGNTPPSGPETELMNSRPQPGRFDPALWTEPGRPVCQAHLPPFAEADLNLTLEQQLKILEIRQAFAKESQPLRFIIEKDQLLLRRLWSEKILNQTLIEATETEVALTSVKLRLMKRHLHEQLNAVLTPEQQKQLQKKRPGPRPPEREMDQTLPR